MECKRNPTEGEELNTTYKRDQRFFFHLTECRGQTPKTLFISFRCIVRVPGEKITLFSCHRNPSGSSCILTGKRLFLEYTQKQRFRSLWVLFAGNRTATAPLASSVYPFIPQPYFRYVRHPGWRQRCNRSYTTEINLRSIPEDYQQAEKRKSLPFFFHSCFSRVESNTLNAVHICDP